MSYNEYLYIYIINSIKNQFMHLKINIIIFMSHFVHDFYLMFALILNLSHSESNIANKAMPQIYFS